VLALITNAARKLRRMLIVAALAVLPVVFTACGTPPNSTPTMFAKSQKAEPLASSSGPPILLFNGTGTSSSGPPILLFNGTGTSSSDVAAVEALLKANKLRYSTADSSELNGMSEQKLLSYQLLFVPGGNSIQIGRGLTRSTTTRIHNAIVGGGLHYIGICAGAFFGGYSIYNGLNLTSGVWFNFYPDHFKGVTKAAVEISSPGGSRLDQYWQNGPQLHGWGEIVGKYPDGLPAIVEGRSGKGWVILSGVHPEAPAGWRSGLKFTTSAAEDNAYAVVLIKAALAGTTLKHY
jgi:glutamine amidotransferase-like uncharacterized protein